MMMRVLITGATGFLGKQLVNKFVHGDNWQVRAIVRPQSSGKLEDHPNLEVCLADLKEINNFKEYLTKCDLVINAAGIVTDWAPRKEYFFLHVKVLQKILDALVSAKIPIIHISTIDVEQHFQGVKTTELSPLSQSTTPYIASKVAAEELVKSYAVKFGIKYNILRPAWFFGVGDTTLIPELVKQIRGGVMFYIKSKNNHIPLISVENAANIIYKIANSNISNEIYNISDPIIISWFQLTQKVAQILNISCRHVVLSKSMALVLATIVEFFAKLLKKKTRPFITTTTVEMLSEDIIISTEKIRSKLNYKGTIDFNNTLQAALRPLMKLSK